MEEHCKICKYKDSCRYKNTLLSNICGIKKIKESDVVRIKKEDK